MKKILKQKKAITLIALVITIVVLVILAVVTISLTVGNDGLIARAIKAAKGYKDAQERDKQSINDLYGELTVAADGTISGLTTEKLQTIINTSIDEKTADLRETVQAQQTELDTQSAAITALNNSLSSINMANTNYKSPILLSNGTSYSNNVALEASKWNTVKQITLNGYGKGKAIASFSYLAESTTVNGIQIRITVSGNEDVANSASYTNSSWHRQSCTGSFNYQEGTVVTLTAYAGTAHTPKYRYQILLLPD